MAIVRELKTVDCKGRILIPKPVLEDVGINPGDKVTSKLPRLVESWLENTNQRR